MAENLAGKKCAPCEGGVDPLTRDQFEPYLEQVADWKVLDDKRIEREFQFKDFAQAIKFVNAVAEIAEEEGHHPDILIHAYKKVNITLWTHAIGGLSINDFIVAAKVDRIAL